MFQVLHWIELLFYILKLQLISYQPTQPTVFVLLLFIRDIHFILSRHMTRKTIYAQ